MMHIHSMQIIWQKLMQYWLNNYEILKGRAFACPGFYLLEEISIWICFF